MLIKTIDSEGFIVILSEDTWYKKLLDPIFGHPEVKPFLKKIETCLKSPEYIFQSYRDPRSKIFFSRILNGPYASYYLAIVVKYVEDQKKMTGYVSTVMINRKLPKKSTLLWQKKALI